VRTDEIDAGTHSFLSTCPFNSIYIPIIARALFTARCRNSPTLYTDVSNGTHTEQKIAVDCGLYVMAHKLQSQGNGELKVPEVLLIFKALL
jgi:hypothetical protein